MGRDYAPRTKCYYCSLEARWDSRGRRIAVRTTTKVRFGQAVPVKTNGIEEIMREAFGTCSKCGKDKGSFWLAPLDSPLLIPVTQVRKSA